MRSLLVLPDFNEATLNSQNICFNINPALLTHSVYNFGVHKRPAMALNEDLVFSSAPADVRSAFVGTPDKVSLKFRTKLYKWTDYDLVGPRGSITPWWSYVEQTRLPSGLVAEGFRASETMAQRLGVTHRQYQKARSAVSEKFNNNLQNLLMIELLADVWGFAGRTNGQPEFKDPALANVFLIGGKGQLWIPNLTVPHVRQTLALSR